MLRIYLNEKLNLYHHIIERNAQMHIISENLIYQTNVFIDFKIINTTLNKLRCCNILLPSRHFFKHLYFPSTITDTSHIPSTITGHVHKYEAGFGYFVDILMGVTFLSIVLFQKQNQKIILCESKKG